MRPRNLSGEGTVSEAGMWSTSSVVMRGSCRYSWISRVYSSSIFCGCAAEAAAGFFCAGAAFFCAGADTESRTSATAAQKTADFMLFLPGRLPRVIAKREGRCQAAQLREDRRAASVIHHQHPHRAFTRARPWLQRLTHHCAEGPRAVARPHGDSGCARGNQQIAGNDRAAFRRDAHEDLPGHGDGGSALPAASADGDSGQVFVRVSAEGGAIVPGDLL